MQQKSKKPVIILAAIAGVVSILAVVAAVLVYTMFMTPEKRLEHQLELGNRYLEEADYDSALVAFDKAIEIDKKSIKAYAGGIAARKEMDDTEQLQEFYEKTLDVMEDLDEDILEDNEDDVIDIYCDAGTVYEEEPEKAMDALESGYKLMDKDKHIYKALTKEYGETADAKTEEGQYEDALEIYDRWLETNEEDQTAVEGLDDTLETYMNELVAEGDLDKCQELADKYRDVSTIDFDTWIAEAQEEQERKAAEEAVLSMIYEYMSSKDYVSLARMKMDGDADDVFYEMEGDHILYAPVGADESYTGKAAGIYTCPNDSDDYYFYFGAVTEGSREGQGTSFTAEGYNYYTVDDLTWQNDKPNGSAHVYQEGETSYSDYITVSDGTMKDGLWDGHVARTLQDDDMYFDLSYDASLGIPTSDVTEEFTSEHTYAGLGYDQYVIAYDSQDGQYWYTYLKHGETVGAIGYADY